MKHHRALMEKVDNIKKNIYHNVSREMGTLRETKKNARD